MLKVSYMTEDGYNKLKEELNRLRGVERPYISQQIAEARDKGDLSENAEYDAAKEAQGMLEMRIANMEMLFASARIVDESTIKTDTVQVLTKVKLRNIKLDKEVEYTLVSENEASVKEKKLSVGTPIALALLGKKVGDVVTAVTPAGEIEFEILNISV